MNTLTEEALANELATARLTPDQVIIGLGGKKIREWMDKICHRYDVTDTHIIFAVEGLRISLSRRLNSTIEPHQPSE